MADDDAFTTEWELKVARKKVPMKTFLAFHFLFCRIELTNGIDIPISISITRMLCFIMICDMPILVIFTETMGTKRSRIARVHEADK